MTDIELIATIRAYHARNDVDGMRAYIEKNAFLVDETAAFQRPWPFLIMVVWYSCRMDLSGRGLVEAEMEWLIGKCCTNATINRHASTRNTALRQAIYDNSVLWCRVLLAHGANPLGALSYVDRNIEIAWLLLEYGCNVAEVDNLDGGMMDTIRRLHQRRVRARAAAAATLHSLRTRVGKDVAALVGRAVWRTRMLNEWDE